MNFILSAPRSGSTWLAKSLNSLSNVFVAEHRLFGNYFDIQPNKKGREILRVTADAYLRSFVNHYAPSTEFEKDALNDLLQKAYLRFISEFTQQVSGEKEIIDKVTPYKDTFRKVLEKLTRYYPDAKIIHLIRDGRDVATSGVFDWLWREETELDRHQYYRQKVPGFTMRRFFDDFSLQNWAEHWKESLVSLNSSKQPRLLVKYEDMITDQVQEIERICDFLQIITSKKSIQLSVQKNSFFSITGRQNGIEQPDHKIRKGVVGDWRRLFTKRDAEIFQRVAGQLLENYRYASTQKWGDSLPTELNLVN